MFRLVRLFLVTSAIAFATVSAAVVFYRQSEVEHLIAFAESQNVALAQAFEIDFVIGRGAVTPRVPHGLSPTLQCTCLASSSEAIFSRFPGGFAYSSAAGREPAALLWREPFQAPAPGTTEREAEPVVEPVLPPLPEFDQHGCQPVAAPLSGSRHVVGIFRRRRRKTAIQVGAVRKRRALGRGPGPQLAAARTRLEVIIGLPARYLGDAPFDSHLAF